MKKILLIILSGIMMITTGCLKDEDGYSLNNSWVGFGILEQVGSDPVEYEITLDNGDVLSPVASGYQLPWYYQGTNDPSSRLKTGDRILINYSVVGDETNDDGGIEKYLVRVNAAKKILKKGILDISEENQDSIGNDRIIVRNAWVTDSLLNFELKYWGRYEMHYINLVKDPGQLTQENLPVELELRHNDNGDLEDILFSAYVSFNLNSIQINELDSVQFRVTSTDYNNEVYEFEGVYKYGENN